jgi:hypothetical protein
VTGAVVWNTGVKLVATARKLGGVDDAGHSPPADETEGEGHHFLVVTPDAAAAGQEIEDEYSIPIAPKGDFAKFMARFSDKAITVASFYAGGTESGALLGEAEKPLRSLALIEPELSQAVDQAFDSGRAQSGQMVQFSAPSNVENYGSKNIHFNENVTIPGAGPDGADVLLRTHSPNPNSPIGSFSRSNYTMQINTPEGLRMLPDGTWKPWSALTDSEKNAIHMPAGN